jgi:hypothetical protein
MIEEGTDVELGDVVEVSFGGFAGELENVEPGHVLEIEDIHTVFATEGITNIAGRSYRLRVIGVRDEDDFGKVLALIVVPRDRVPVAAMPVPGGC